MSKLTEVKLKAQKLEQDNDRWQAFFDTLDDKAGIKALSSVGSREWVCAAANETPNAK